MVIQIPDRSLRLYSTPIIAIFSVTLILILDSNSKLTTYGFPMHLSISDNRLTAVLESDL